MDIDVVVVGAGVIGLAVARELSGQAMSVLILESASAIGTGTSSRNSEVIHAGLYYPEGSLKARLCIEGKQMLYAFCESHGVPFKRCGKLIVASSEAEIAAIEALLRKGVANGCTDLQLLTREEALALEPELECAAALHSPSTGILDSHSYMLALLGDAEDAGASLALNTPLLSASALEGGFHIAAGGAEPMELSCRMLINAAGLHATHVARSIRGLSRECVPTTGYAKGNYFRLSGRAPFQHLIYPAPHTHGLGVHLTLDLGGQAKFGPDIEWVDSIDYSVNPDSADSFAEAVRRYWPGMPKDSLTPAYSGIRPKISGPSDPAADFRIDGPKHHGISGLINLFGIESPGLTSSLAIARYVAAML